MLLRGKVCIVSGVGPGLGRALARALAEQGADLALIGRSAERGSSVARELDASGLRILCAQADVTDLASCQAALARILEHFGRVDVLVNNAFATGPMGPLVADSVMKSWRPAFKVNVFGTLQLTQLVAETMKPRHSGSVVMINSLAARTAQPNLAAYGASKAALLAASRSLAVELGPHGIRVNSVVPGHIDGPALDVFIQMEAQRQSIGEAQARAQIAAQAPLNRIPSSQQVADAVVFFASDMSQAVTGQTMDVNCGQWLP